MIFLPPVFFLLFSFVFFSVWLLERGRHYLMLFGVAFFLVFLAAFVQVSFMPADYGLNAVISAILYVSGALWFVHGILLRSGKHLSYWFHALFFMIIIGGTIYFFYIERNLFYRIYFINWGMGAIFLAAAWKARFLLYGSMTDKILFWLIFVLGAHFFPRTLLTAERITFSSVPDFVGSPFWLVLQFTITVAGVGMGLGLLGVTFADIIVELRKERDTDILTGLPNRRLFSEHINTRLQEGVRQNKPVTFAMIDVDYFKLYNDFYGHSAGDAALKSVANVISSIIQRPEDMAARIGGEEFGLFFYGRTLEQSKSDLDLVRERIAARGIEHSMSPVSGTLTVSIGVSEFAGNEDFESLFKRADTLLYSSKATGRNQMTMARLPPV